MNTNAEAAQILIEDLHIDFLLQARARIYAVMEENRRLARAEHESTTQLKAAIREMGVALNECRVRGIEETNPIYISLVRQVRALNHERADNRFHIRLLSEQQAVHKAALAELNREISQYDLSDDWIAEIINHY